MKKIAENEKQNSMQLHIDAAYKLIGDHLPKSYVDEVKKELSADQLKITTDKMIINVRQRRQNPEKHLVLLNAILTVAKKNKTQKEALVENLKN